MPEILPGETILENDYPIYAGYVYVVNGEPWMSPMTAQAWEVKRRFGFDEIRRCELVKRQIAAEKEASGV